MSDKPETKQQETQEYLAIMQPPSTFEDGFGTKTVIGAIFLGFFMMPGSMYLSLFMGQGLGSAAQWVTVILFAEVARRSLKGLRQQEIYILFYMTGIALASPFQSLLWNQYLVQSDVAQGMGVASGIPHWVAPSAETIKRMGNTFFNRYWLAPILLISFQVIISRVNGFGLGYALYRLTAHAEKLPFPMAPVGALGAMVLAEDKESRDHSRWTVFSVGAMLGLFFGLIYIGIPALTGCFLGTPHQLLPIPWMDLTAATQKFLPATPTNIIFDLSLVVIGMVLPFWAVIGGGIGLVLVLAGNPWLYRHGILSTWRPGMGIVDTLYSNSIDFYLSLGIGLVFAVFLISVGTTLRPLIVGWLRKGTKRAAGPAPAGTRFLDAFRYNRLRGDIPVWISIGIYVLSTIGYIFLCRYLIPGFPFWFFMAFAFLYTPTVSYASAKLEGLVGQSASIPLVQTASYILSGYKGVAIWFAPIPIVDYGPQTRTFREVELTGTRVTSLIKTELVTIPVVIVASLLFSEFIWRLGPIPSEAYPFTQEIWRLNALNSCLTCTATMEGGSKFMEAINPRYIGYGLAIGVGAYAILSVLSLPTFIVFGLVRGVGLTSGQVLLEVIGALVGRFYLEKRFGRMQWRRMAPVFLAGFFCGVGLMAMASIGIALIAKSISPLLF